MNDSHLSFAERLAQQKASKELPSKPQNKSHHPSSEKNDSKKISTSSSSTKQKDITNTTQNHSTHRSAPRLLTAHRPAGLPKFNILTKPRPEYAHSKKKSDMGQLSRLDFMKTYDPEYDFLEEVLLKELENLYEKYSNVEKGSVEATQIKRDIDRNETRLRIFRKNKLKYEIKNQFYEAQAKRLEKTGRDPKYLSNAQLDMLVKKREYEKMKSDGTLEKYLKKKRKRNFGRDVNKILPAKKPRASQ